MIVHDRKFGGAFLGHVQPQQTLAALQHVKERAFDRQRCAALSSLGSLDRVRSPPARTRASVFHHAGLRGIVTPPEQSAFIDGVKRIDHHQRAG